MNKINRRSLSFTNTNTALTSKRVAIILSNSSDSEELVKAVRANRYQNNSNNSFKISEESEKVINSYTIK